MVKFGDSPHVVSLTFLPLAILALDYALEEPSIWRRYIAAIAAASVVTTNWLGGFGLAMVVVSYVMAQIASRSPLKLTAFSFFFSIFCPALVVGWERWHGPDASAASLSS
jgi:hypothetical protein